MDFTVFLDENTDIHHIFPRAYCESKNIDKTKWNSIVNKTPLFARTNRIIGGNAPSEYLKKIKASNHVDEKNLNSYVATHKINVNDLHNDNFDDYFIKRAQSLLDLISSAMTKPISNLNGDDVIAAFGGQLN
jgi:hypothetical protein